MAGLSGSLSDGDIAGEVELTNWRGDRLKLPHWRVLQHHADLARLLTARGRSQRDFDFLTGNLIHSRVCYDFSEEGRVTSLVTNETITR